MIFIQTEIEAVFGCAERGKTKYFLVKFKGENEKKIIDWEMAKKYPLIFMEYFGDRLTWPPLHEIISSSDNEDDADPDQDDTTPQQSHESEKQAEPNDIEWDI